MTERTAFTSARPQYDAYALTVLSPHLDEGVLSCGGRLADCADGGGQAPVVTLFAGDEPPVSTGALAHELRRAWNLPPGQVLEARREEDLAAGSRVGADAILAYASQDPLLFHTGSRLRKQLRRAARRAGGERIWRRRSTPTPAARKAPRPMSASQPSKSEMLVVVR